MHAHTHTHTNISNNNNNNNDDDNNKKRQYQPPTPRDNSQGIGAINCCRKDLHTRGCRDPGTTSFLIKCNLTKDYLASVYLLKHIFTSC